MISLSVNISEAQKSYPINIEWDSISSMREKILSYVQGKKFLVVISEKVEKLYGKELGFTKEEKFILKDGEKQKNFKNYEKILNLALKMQLTRKDAIIAIGGGVVFDYVDLAVMRRVGFRLHQRHLVGRDFQARCGRRHSRQAQQHGQRKQHGQHSLLHGTIPPHNL